MLPNWLCKNSIWPDGMAPLSLSAAAWLAIHGWLCAPDAATSRGFWLCLAKLHFTHADQA